MGTLIGTTVAAGHKEFIGNYDISERFKLVSLLHLCLALVALVALVATDDAVRLISRVFGIQQQFTCLANRGLSAPCSSIHLLLSLVVVIAKAQKPSLWIDSLVVAGGGGL